MSNQQVTKGRIVEFFPGEKNRFFDSSQSWPAIVTSVYDGGVHLVVFSGFGANPTGTLVPHKQEAVEGRDYWDWFPMVSKSPSADPIEIAKNHALDVFGLIKSILYGEQFILLAPALVGETILVTISVGGKSENFGPVTIPVVDGSTPMETIPFSGFTEERLNQILTDFALGKGGGK